MSSPIISRAGLPEEFMDVVSAAVLRQPEPQYLHASLFKQALSGAFNIENMGSMGLPIGNRAIPSGGAPYTDAVSDRLMLAMPDPVYSAAIKVVPEMSDRVGHTVRINRPRFGDSVYTLASREVASGSQISTTAIDLSSEQVTLTLKRYVGPSNGTNPAPYAVDKLDATRSVHSMAGLVGKHMQRDLDKFLDKVMVTLLGSGTTTLWPGSVTSDNTPTAVGDMPGDLDVLFRAEETLRLANIAPFSNGRYMAIITPTFARQLKQDPMFQRLSRYFPQTNPIYQSYLATCGALDIFLSNTLSSANNSNSVPVYTNQVFGPEMVGAGVSRLPTVVPNTQDNYGEQALLVWIMYAAFGVLDARFGVQIHTA